MRSQTLVRFFAGAELFALFAFIIGYFTNFYPLMIVGGVLLIIQDIFSMAQGILKPLGPIMLAIILGFVFTPWYVGVIWSVAVFMLLDIPTDLRRLKTGQLP